MGWLDKLFKKGDAVVVDPPKEDKQDKKPYNIIDYGAKYYYNHVTNQVETEPGKVYAVEELQKDVPKTMVSKIVPLDLMKVSFEASPNKSNRVGDVEYLVLHHTGPGTFNGVVSWLCNPQAKASAHYVLGRAAELKQLVNTSKEAWHAGVARLNNEQINNHKSIGVEICNNGRMEKGEDGFYYYEIGRSLKKYTGSVEPVPGIIVYPSGQAVSGYYAPYPEKQLNKLVALCKALVEKYPAITRDNILTHYSIGSPEGRKNDPFGLDMEMIKNMIFG